MNVLTVDDQRYLVAPRGVTQWVRNLRVARRGELRVGRRRGSFQAVELTDAEKPAILRAYLKRWKAEVGVFFGERAPTRPTMSSTGSPRIIRCSASRQTPSARRPNPEPRPAVHAVRWFVAARHGP